MVTRSKQRGLLRSPAAAIFPQQAKVPPRRKEPMGLFPMRDSRGGLFFQERCRGKATGCVPSRRQANCIGVFRLTWIGLTRTLDLPRAISRGGTHPCWLGTFFPARGLPRPCRSPPLRPDFLHGCNSTEGRRIYDGCIECIGPLGGFGPVPSSVPSPNPIEGHVGSAGRRFRGRRIIS